MTPDKEELEQTNETVSESEQEELTEEELLKQKIAELRRRDPFIYREPEQEESTEELTEEELLKQKIAELRRRDPFIYR